MAPPIYVNNAALADVIEAFTAATGRMNSRRIAFFEGIEQSVQGKWTGDSQQSFARLNARVSESIQDMEKILNRAAPALGSMGEAIMKADRNCASAVF